MDARFRKDATQGCTDSPPSEAWLFAQAIQGKPIPRIISPEAQAKAKREKLERLAQISSRHAEELRRLRSAEAKARHKRELLEWAAQFSTRHADQLHSLLRAEAEEREAWRRAERFVAIVRGKDEAFKRYAERKLGHRAKITGGGIVRRPPTIAPL